MNNQLRIDYIKSAGTTHSIVRLAQDLFARTKPGLTDSIPYTELGWTSSQNGDLVRVYDFNGVEVRSHWNPTEKTRFVVTNEVAQAHLVPQSARPQVSLPYDLKSFTKVATA